MLRIRSFGPCVAALAGAIALPAPAVAQSVDLSTNTIEPQPQGRRDDNLKPLAINREDCLQDRWLELHPQLSEFRGLQFEVWVGRGTDCTDVTNRNSASRTCWRVYSEEATTRSPTVEIHAQDIAAGFADRTADVGSGTCESCLAYSGSSGPQQITLYLMLLKGDTVQGRFKTWETSFDVIGPEPPVNLSAGTGEESVVLNFELADTADQAEVREYRIFCDGGSSDPAQPSSLQASCASAAGAGGATSGAAGAPATTEDSGGSTGTGTNGGTCTSSALVPGEIPAFRACKNVSGGLSSEATVSNLTNDVSYAFGVAAVDSVGNVGELSQLECATPAPVVDFFEAYRDAGGQAGGGFCAFSTKDTWLGGLSVAAASLILLRRRRRSQA